MHKFKSVYNFKNNYVLLYFKSCILFFTITLLVNQALALNINGTEMDNKIIIWDNDGTIIGSLDPNDKSPKSKVILPGVKEVMKVAKLNF